MKKLLIFLLIFCTGLFIVSSQTVAQHPFTVKDLFSTWGQVPVGYNTDLNHDEQVNTIDYAIYLYIPLPSPKISPALSPLPSPSVSPIPTPTPSLDKYQCPGIIENSLCYNGTKPIAPTTLIYENDKLKISAEYEGRTEIGSEFTATLLMENKTNQTLNLSYFLSTYTKDFYQVKSFNNFPGAVSNNEKSSYDYMIILSPGSSKIASGSFIALKPNIFSDYRAHSGSFIRFQVDGINGSNSYNETVNLQTVIPFSSGEYCGDERFPKTYDYQVCTSLSSCGKTDEYSQSKCCDGVFYPGFDCCSSADCNEGSMCIDGLCNTGYIKNQIDKAFGTKNTLFIILDSSTGSPPDIQTSCIINNEIITNRDELNSMTNSIEDYYDEMVKTHTQESEDFLNFSFDFIGPFWLSQLGLDHNTNKGIILNTIEDRCNLSNTRDAYAEIIISGYGLPSIGYRGLAGKPIISELNRNTLVHEIAHNFGCNHINGFDMGTTLQWAKELMGWSLRHGVNVTPTLQVCRGELGWVDINKNGILDVQE